MPLTGALRRGVGVRMQRQLPVLVLSGRLGGRGHPERVRTLPCCPCGFASLLAVRTVRTLQAQSCHQPPCRSLHNLFPCRAGLGQGLGVALLFRSVPATHHMLGPLDAQPRQRRAVQRQAKRKAPVGESEMSFATAAALSPLLWRQVLGCLQAGAAGQSCSPANFTCGSQCPSCLACAKVLPS